LNYTKNRILFTCLGTSGSSLPMALRLIDGCIEHTCVCEPHPNRGSAIRHTEHNHAMEICNGTQTVMLGNFVDFVARLITYRYPISASSSHASYEQCVCVKVNTLSTLD